MVNREMVIPLHNCELDSAVMSSFKVVTHVLLYLGPVF